MYCIDAWSEGWRTSRSFWNKNITVAHTNDAKIGNVCAGSAITFFFTGSLANPIIIRENRYNTIYFGEEVGRRRVVSLCPFVVVV